VIRFFWKLAAWRMLLKRAATPRDAWNYAESLADEYYAFGLSARGALAEELAFWGDEPCWDKSPIPKMGQCGDTDQPPKGGA
jgi:hypothetical protein